MQDSWWEMDNPFGYKRDSWSEDEEQWLAAEPRIVKVCKTIIIGCVLIFVVVSAVGFGIVLIRSIIVGI
jgi:hypothetical protein